MTLQLGFEAPEIVCRVCHRGEGHAHWCGLPRARREELEGDRERAAALAAEAEAWRSAAARREEPAIAPGVVAPPSPTGQELAAEGMARAMAAEPVRWLERADAAIAELARAGAPFTAEEIRHLAGDPEHPNAMGGRINAACRRKIIRCVGRRPAERPSLHGHEIRLWQGVAR